MNSINKTGKIIQQMRLQYGITQQELASALHVTDKAISKWERGICLPDTVLLPKIALILDIDLEILLSKSIELEKWVGLIDIEDCDFSQNLYDKPLIHYILSHFLLLGIKNIYILTDKKNENYLNQKIFNKLGFTFHYNLPKNKNIMMINRPWFLFGSDLTEQFQGSILSDRFIKLMPENQSTVFYFIPMKYNNAVKDIKLIEKKATKKTLGRGMIAFDMSDKGNILDASYFVRTYQKNTRLAIASLEEISYNKGYISLKECKQLISSLPYKKLIELNNI